MTTPPQGGLSVDLKTLLGIIGAALIVLGAASQAGGQARANLAATPYPQSIRVAIRESRPGGEPDPEGRIIYVKTVNFDEYGKDSLPNEWYPSWQREALQAGAIAVKMFGWYHRLNPVTLDGFTFDVDNTVNFQTYREGRRNQATDEAWEAVRNLAYVEQDGSIFELNYRAGLPNDPNWAYRNSQKMAQWGSQYWADRGRNMLQILQFYYEGRLLTRIPGL